MPTSQSEAEKIVSIISEYIAPPVAKELMSRLFKEVGEPSDNDSLRISLRMLSSLYDDE
jgi:hypothetical protein